MKRSRAALLTSIAALAVIGIAAGIATLWIAASREPFGPNEEANERFAAGDFRTALARYRALQQTWPELPELSVNAGNALHRLQEYSRALSDYEQAVGQADEKLGAIAHYNRGNTLFRLGRLVEAREAYVESLRRDPANRDAKFNIEVMDRLGEQARQQRQQSGQQTQPGQQGQQGQPQPGGQPGQQPAPPGQGRPGQQQPPSSGDSSASPGPSVNEVLREFRRNLTVEEALRLLEALRREQRGIEALIEGPVQERGEPRY